MQEAENTLLPEGVNTISGTPAEVRKRLDGSKAEQVVAVTMPSKGIANLVARMVAMLADLDEIESEIRMERQQEKIRALIAAFMPDEPVPPTVMIEAEMQAHARTQILKSGDWMTAADISKAAGFSDSNRSAQPNKWKNSGRIFTIQFKGQDLYPSYGLDPENEFRPIPAMAKVLEVFKDHKEGWQLAFWFASANGYLGKKRPQDLLKADVDRLIRAAQRDAAGVTHG